MQTENDYRNFVLKNCSGWVERIEKGRGTRDGFPDLVFLLNGIMIPVELKRGTIEGGYLLSDNIRPSQIQWHSNFVRHGGKSLLLVGSFVSRGVWRSFVADVSSVDCWPSGRFKIGADCFELEGRDFHVELGQFVWLS